MLLLPADSTILVCTRVPLILLYDIEGSVQYGPQRAHTDEKNICMGYSSSPLIHPLTNCHVVNRVDNRPCSPI